MSRTIQDGSTDGRPYLLAVGAVVFVAAIGVLTYYQRHNPKSSLYRQPTSTSRPSPPASGRAGDASQSVPAATSAPARPIVSTGPEWPMPTEAQMRRRRQDVNHFFAALRMKESSDGKSPVGDGGKSHGPYHISRRYFGDAVGDMTGWEWPRDVMDRDKSEFLISCYMHRHAYLAWVLGDWEAVARVHKGGPRGDVKAATLPYWREVSEIMEN